MCTKSRHYAFIAASGAPAEAAPAGVNLLAFPLRSHHEGVARRTRILSSDYKCPSPCENSNLSLRSNLLPHRTLPAANAQRGLATSSLMISPRSLRILVITLALTLVTGTRCNPVSSATAPGKCHRLGANNILWVRHVHRSCILQWNAYSQCPRAASFSFSDSSGVCACSWMSKC